MMLKNIISVLKENEDTLFSSVETAELLGNSKAWLEWHRWAGTGIPFDKVGRTPYYRGKSLLVYITNENIDD